MTPMEKVAFFEEKIGEYFLSCSAIKDCDDLSFLKEWPLYKFSIKRIFEHCSIHDLDSSRVADKLIDIKLLYAYLLTTFEHFYRGPTLIVGRENIAELNPASFSLLRQIHYKVYLLSVLFESTFDFLVFVLEGKFVDKKKGKWEHHIGVIRTKTGDNLISDQEQSVLTAFHHTFRTSEMHKFSRVRAFTNSDKWNHLQQEEAIAGSILAKMSEYQFQRGASTPKEFVSAARPQRGRAA